MEKMSVLNSLNIFMVYLELMVALYGRKKVYKLDGYGNT